MIILIIPFFKIYFEFVSKFKPEISFIILTPRLIPFSIISDFLVSNDTGIFLQVNFNISLILFHSVFELTPLEPGLVDSPPISIIFAPEENNSFAFSRC